jgi:primosomal protein N' (replication factor Y)
MKINLNIYFIDVLLPLALPKAYTYFITEDQYALLSPGFRVAVSFGKQKIYTGIVTKVHKVAPQTYEPKPIVMILDKSPIITTNQINFWNWISNYYMCTEGEVLRASLPSALMIESESVLVKCEVTEEQLDSLSDLQYIVFEALDKQNLSLDDISKITEINKVMPLVLDMIDKKAAMIHQKIEEKFKPKKTRVVRLMSGLRKSNQLEEVFIKLERAPKQKAIIMALINQGGDLNSWLKVSKLKEVSQVKSSHIKALIDRKILEESYIETNRLLIREVKSQIIEKSLSKSQSIALKNIKTQFLNKDVVLLEGVTSSGKTEVYINLIEKQIKAQKQVLYLLPEISLTSQIVKRLTSRFGDQVLVYHSRFSIHERTEVWNQVLDKNSQRKIIVGARSSIFLPFQDLGLVIIDEEHENSYKQFDPAPRYQARDSAIYLAQSMNAKVLLGSATPSMETAENVRNEKYGWVKLKERFGGVSLPKIELINLKEAHRKKNMKGVFSKNLVESISETLTLGKQVILFQNRRGYAPILECLSCGYSPQCTQCDVSLTYHQVKNQLCCHYCGYNISMPTSCHSCGMTTLSTKGYGTQQIEEQIKKLFPEASVGRMDWDSTRGKWDFDKIIEGFENERVQILVGTQMVVKGLDFKNVLLVGVINADHVLNLPDFRAHERSYQMLCQVAGRAGRSDNKGKVIIQTFQPHHPILKYVIEHDYEGLYTSQEIERKNYHYPPYYRIIRITFKSRQYETLNISSEWFSNVFKQSYQGSVLGPVFPAISRVRNQFIKQLLIKIDYKLNSNQVKSLLKKTYKSFQAIAVFRNIRVNFDVDPY